MSAAYLKYAGQQGYVPNGCKKIAFASKQDAQKQLRKMGDNDEANRGHLNVYPCQLGCDSWHIGHKPLKAKRKKGR
jgi:hypothetical protein